MDVLVSHQVRFVECGGRLYSPHLGYDRFARRYLGVFDRVVLLSRTEPADCPQVGMPEATGPGVEYVRLPAYRGPAEYLKKRKSIVEACRKAMAETDVCMLRVPGGASPVCWKLSDKMNRPYAVEVVADPWDAFGKGASDHWLRPLLRWFLTYRLKAICREASVCSYITQEALQRRYPTKGEAVACSDVNLPNAGLVELDSLESRLDSILDHGPKHTWVVGHIGSMAQPYKDQWSVLRAVAQCRHDGFDVRLRLVGQGRFLDSIRQLCRNLGLWRFVDFVEMLPSCQKVIDFMDGLDFYVLPSLAEGQGRSLIEAMARGLPCVATAVGGLVELLPEDSLIPPKAPQELAKRLKRLMTDADCYRRQARRNREFAERFHEDRLLPIQHRAYRRLVEIVRSRGGSSSASRRTGC